MVTNETKKKLEDFCECLSVQGVDCVNEENSDVCTSFCEVTSGFDQRYENHYGRRISQYLRPEGKIPYKSF